LFASRANALIDCVIERSLIADDIFADNGKPHIFIKCLLARVRGLGYAFSSVALSLDSHSGKLEVALAHLELTLVAERGRKPLDANLLSVN
jgi:hypothetical protein